MYSENTSNKIKTPISAPPPIGVYKHNTQTKVLCNVIMILYHSFLHCTTLIFQKLEVFYRWQKREQTARVI